MKKPSAPQILLALAVFLAPIIGGQINTEATVLEPGLKALVRSVFSNVDGMLTYLIHSYQPPPSIDTPTLSHALVALLIAAAVIVLLLRRRVLQVPLLRVSVPLMLFMAWLLCTVLFSQFTTISLTAVAEWLSYGVVFYAVIGAAGRRGGSFLLVSAIVLGCTIVAMKGLFEYGAERPFDPTWRVFSTWANPTSLAGILTIGLMLGLGLAIYLEDIPAVIPWTGALAMACCIMLTDARGGIYSMLAGLVCLAGFTTFWQQERNKRLIGLAKIGAVLVLAIAFGRWAHPVIGSHTAVTDAKPRMMLAGQMIPPPAPATNTGNAAVQGEQSSGFRILLWKGAAKLIKSNPVGTGFGTYRFESTKPGLTTETQLAHNSYLQIGVEAGLIGLLCFIAFLALWLYEVVRGCKAPLRAVSLFRTLAVMVAGYASIWIFQFFAHVELFPSQGQKLVAAFGLGLVWLYVEVFRGSTNLIRQQNILRASIIAGIVCMLFDNMLESGLYSYGIGITAFALLGLGLVQAADGVAPEFIPRVPRVTACIVAAVASLFLLHSGVVEMFRSMARYQIQVAQVGGLATAEGRDAIEAANADLDAALNVLPIVDQADGETWRIKAAVEPSLFQSAEDYKHAAELHPSTKNDRAVGMAEAEQGSYDEAIQYYYKALENDPNNLPTLSALRDAYTKNQEPAKAIEIAQRTIAVENTDYFKVRSLPQIIPTDTYEAWAFLARISKNPSEQTADLEKSVAGFQLYLQNTVPLLEQMTAASGGNANVNYGGETLSLARYKMRNAASYALALANIYRQQGRPAEAARAMQIEQAFAVVGGTPGT